MRCARRDGDGGVNREMILRVDGQGRIDGLTGMRTTLDAF
jgi:hypothetical protein